MRWAQFDAVVIQTCWDYHLRAREFLAWADGVEAGGTSVINAPGLLRWNHHKRYLAALQQAGIPVVPTAVLADPGADLEAIAAGWDARELVVKPAVSASAMSTWRVIPGTAEATRRLGEILARGEAIVQPFLEDIEAGEYSLIFFDGAFSHAVLKIPAAGDFRVQGELGGRTQPVVPPRPAIEAARRVLEAAPALPTYARVDGVLTGSAFVLMELELIEPELFLWTAEGAPARFAGRVVDRLARGAAT